MERNIAWARVLPGHGADTNLMLSRTEAWLSLAMVACAVFITIGTFGGALWMATVTS